MNGKGGLLIFWWIIGCGASCANQWAVASAEEYFSIGMAYFDNGKYAEAEKWLNRAKSVDKTKTASEYNLGRIAFERKRYNEALGYFEGILEKDPYNVMVLKAAAYTHIKRNNLKAAEALYERVLALAPESADDGYNYALILYTMGEYERAELVLVAHPFGMLENSEVILLHARILKAQGKPEAADRYHQWLETNTDPLVRYEYGLILEERGFYARAVEEFRRILKELTQDHKELKKAEAQYALARLLLKADPAGNEGIVELEGAVAGGFHDRERLETLLALSGISQSHKESIRRIIEKTPVQESGGKAP